MIGRLRGRVADVSDNVILLDVGGVGYEVEVTTSALANLSGQDGEALVFTHFVVRDDHHALFGFANQSERDLFREVIKISGVGPKLGLTLLSAFGPEEFARYVAERDVNSITRVPGIGKKTAERLVIELKDKLDGVPLGVEKPHVPVDAVVQEAKLALVSLGYRPTEASRVLEQVYAEGEPVETLIRDALQRLVASA